MLRVKDGKNISSYNTNWRKTWILFSTNTICPLSRSTTTFFAVHLTHQMLHRVLFPWESLMTKMYSTIYTELFFLALLISSHTNIKSNRWTALNFNDSTIYSHPNTLTFTKSINVLSPFVRIQWNLPVDMKSNVKRFHIHLSVLFSFHYKQNNHPNLTFNPRK